MNRYILLYFHILLVSGARVSLQNSTAVTSGHVVHTTKEERLSYDDEQTEKSVILNRGEALTMECYFARESWVFVQWIKFYGTSNQDRLSSIVDSKRENYNSTVIVTSILLEDVTQKDSGNYRCFANSEKGTTTMEFIVKVKDEMFCSDSTCGSKGTCRELVDSYVCECEPGYIGDQCENLDYCFSQPCQNNGTCFTRKSGVECLCARGYNGELCQNEACLPETCNFAGNCSETVDGGVECECYHNRAGERCHHQCTFTRRCWEGQTCVIHNSGSQRCYCENERGVKHCLVSSDVRNECMDPNPCSDRGSCSERIYKYKCSCYNYAYGESCEYHNECRAYPSLCGFQGTCVDKKDGYECICPENQYGDRCQFSSKPCKVTCLGDQMKASCDLRFLNKKLDRIPIKTNAGQSQCIFSSRNSGSRYTSYNGIGYRLRKFIAVIPYNQCETTVEINDNFAIYRNSLFAGKTNLTGNDGVISRESGFFQFDMECKQALEINETNAGIESISFLTNETMHVSDEESIVVQTKLSYYNSKWQSINNYQIGDRLYIKLELLSPKKNHLMSEASIIPRNCYVTPNDTSEQPRYDLLENGCIKEDSFVIEKRSVTGFYPMSFFSFDSFSFVGDYPKIYLFCDARICFPGQGELGSCRNECLEENANQERWEAIQNTTVARQKREIGILRNDVNMGNNAIDRITRKIISIVT